MFDIEKARSAGNLRSLKKSQTNGKFIKINGQKLLNLASNDYLGIATNTDLRDEFLQIIKEKNLFFGGGASRLVYTASSEFDELESYFEGKFSGKKAIIFNSGYAANLGVISALCDEKTLFLADKLIHASMIDAFKLGGANFKRYAHLDYENLENLIKKNYDKFDNIIILSEAIFSMDGDESDISRLCELKNRFEKVKIYLDEAHSFFALNEFGSAKTANLDTKIDFILITLGKALGGEGGVMLCDEKTHQIIVNSARSLIYSTAIAPVNIAWTNFVLSKDFSFLRENLHKNCEFIGLSKTQICPFVIGDSQKTLKTSEKLAKFGYFIPAIRPPTVPQNSARLRISLRGDLEISDLANLKAILNEI